MDINHVNENKDVVSDPELGRKENKYYWSGYEDSRLARWCPEVINT